MPPERPKSTHHGDGRQGILVLEPVLHLARDRAWHDAATAGIRLLARPAPRASARGGADQVLEGGSFAPEWGVLVARATISSTKWGTRCITGSRKR